MNGYQFYKLIKKVFRVESLKIQRTRRRNRSRSAELLEDRILLTAISGFEVVSNSNLNDSEQIPEILINGGQGNLGQSSADVGGGPAAN